MHISGRDMHAERPVFRSLGVAPPSGKPSRSANNPPCGLVSAGMAPRDGQRCAPALSLDSASCGAERPGIRRINSLGHWPAPAAALQPVRPQWIPPSLTAWLRTRDDAGAAARPEPTSTPYARRALTCPSDPLVPIEASVRLHGPDRAETRFTPWPRQPRCETSRPVLRCGCRPAEQSAVRRPDASALSFGSGPPPNARSCRSDVAPTRLVAIRQAKARLLAVPVSAPAEAASGQVVSATARHGWPRSLARCSIR